MSNLADHIYEEARENFLLELNRRTKVLPIRSTQGNKCISINMDNCSIDFVLAAEEFLSDNKKYFRVHVKGDIYFIEVLRVKRARAGLLL